MRLLQQGLQFFSVLVKIPYPCVTTVLSIFVYVHGAFNFDLGSFILSFPISWCEFCRRVIVARAARVKTVKKLYQIPHILIACRISPPEPDMVIVGWVRPGKTYKESER